MPLIPKPNYNQIFASQAPDIDKPAVFNNYPEGWGPESRPNNGKPTIKGFNYLQQTSDLKDLWILQNGACLPYDDSIEYAEGAPVLKDGVIQYKTADGFKSRDSVTIPTYSSAADGVDPITGVADGAYFNVRSSLDESYIDEYQNVGGVPTPTGKSYPSSAYVQNIEEHTALPFVDGKTYAVNKRVILESGDIVRSTVAGNTTDPNVDMTGWEFEPVILKYNEITGSIKRALSEVIYDLTLDVTWFGAKPDHDFRTGLGTVNDVAFQNCINFIGSLGSIRDGGKVKVIVPSGPYQLQHLDINTYPKMGFGLEFVGAGINSTMLYFDESYTTKEAISSFMEGVVFRDIGFFGSLTSVNPVVGRTIGYVGKNLSGNADIDVTFDNCRFRAWDKFAEIHGRGFVATGGTIGGVNRFLTIVNGTYNDSTPDKPNNIMRHYRIQWVRFDSIGVLVKVEGTKPEQQINDLLITGDDIYTVNRLIEFDGFTLNNLSVTVGNSAHSFATAMVRGTHLKNSIITGMGVLHRVDNASIPTADGQCVGKVLDLLGDSIGNIITGNVIKNLRENIAHIRGDAIGNIITDNALPECWSWSNASQERVLVQFGTGVRKGNIITNNSASSSVFSGTFKQTNLPLAALVDNIVKDNAAPWTWADAIQTASVNVYSSTTDMTTGISVDNRLCKFVIEGDYIVGVVHLLADTTNTGAISLGLPVPALAEFPTITSAFGGGGQILNIAGFSVVGAVPSGVVVNPATQRLEFYKFKDMVRSSINWNDGTGSRRLFASFRYRYK